MGGGEREKEYFEKCDDNAKYDSSPRPEPVEARATPKN